MLTETEIREMFNSATTIAVVGISSNPERDSNGVARFLQRQGYRVIPVNPTLEGELLGEQVYASLRDIPEPVDVVQIFRRSEFVPEIVDEAIAIKAKYVWMQLGVIHPEAAQKAQAAGMRVAIDRCMAIEHRRLMH